MSDYGRGDPLPDDHGRMWEGSYRNVAGSMGCFASPSVEHLCSAWTLKVVHGG